MLSSAQSIWKATQEAGHNYCLQEEELGGGGQGWGEICTFMPLTIFMDAFKSMNVLAPSSEKNYFHCFVSLKETDLVLAGTSRGLGWETWAGMEAMPLTGSPPCLP